MAMYFNGNPAEFQAPDGLQTLFLMSPTTYLQQQQQLSGKTAPPAEPLTPSITHNNLIFTNPSSLSLHSPPPPPHTHQDDTISSLHGLLPPVPYNLDNPNYPTPLARESPRAKQGLSLSLSSQQQPHFGSRPSSQVVSGGSGYSGSVIINGVSGMQSVLLSCKYLKAAQELLDEVVIVNYKSELSKKDNGNNNSNSNRVIKESSAAAGDDGESAGKRAAELSTADRQEIQMKKAKLINMFDEVERRFRQYHHQIQIVISSFEQATGIGSAKTYTSLALNTISKQFRCLKEAIIGHTKAANKMLGEEDSIGGKTGSSRLKFVDHRLRQQRALQQLGMIQHNNNAWRSQRGLPERSVSALRAWLFEHFLHPYPKDSDKQMLATQTGLTRSQVSNWFINARVRLWKPMVEDMYLEEVKQQEQKGSKDKSEHNEDLAYKPFAPQEKNLVNETQIAKNFKSSDDNLTNQNVHSVISMSNLTTWPIESSEFEGILTQRSSKKPRNNEMNMILLSPRNVPSSGDEADNDDQMSMKFDDDRQSTDGYAFIGSQMNFIQGFGQYPNGEIGRFDAEQLITPSFSSDGVSLTLGLPHCENLSLSETHQNFLPNQNIQLGRRAEIGEPNEFGTNNTLVSSLMGNI